VDLAPRSLNPLHSHFGSTFKESGAKNNKSLAPPFLKVEKVDELDIQ